MDDCSSIEKTRGVVTPDAGVATLVARIVAIPCPHFYRGTDGVHACIVERCNHPDRGEWGVAMPGICLSCEYWPNPCSRPGVTECDEFKPREYINYRI